MVQVDGPGGSGPFGPSGPPFDFGPNPDMGGDAHGGGGMDGPPPPQIIGYRNIGNKKIEIYLKFVDKDPSLPFKDWEVELIDNGEPFYRYGGKYISTAVRDNSVQGHFDTADNIDKVEIESYTTHTNLNLRLRDYGSDPPNDVVQDVTQDGNAAIVVTKLHNQFKI